MAEIKAVLETYKSELSRETGIPEILLHGETATEILDNALILSRYAGSNIQEEPKTTRDSFAEWTNGQGYTPPLQEETTPDTRPPREQFIDWAAAVL